MVQLIEQDAKQQPLDHGLDSHVEHTLMEEKLFCTGVRVSVSQKLERQAYTLLKLFICLQTFFVFLFYLKYFRCLDAVLFQCIVKSGPDQPYNLTKDALRNSSKS